MMAAKGRHPQEERWEMRQDEKGAAVGDFTGLAIRVAREPWTWSGLDFVSSPNPDFFVLQLSGEDIGQIEETLRTFKSQHLTTSRRLFLSSTISLLLSLLYPLTCQQCLTINY